MLVIGDLERKLRNYLERTKSMGLSISRDGDYAYGDKICLLGAVALVSGVPIGGYMRTELVARHLGLNMLETKALEFGFCWPQAESVRGEEARREFWDLGDRLACEFVGPRPARRD